MGSTNSNFRKYPQDFLCFLETNFWEGKSSYQVNISHYLYPNDYNPSIGIFSFNMYLLVKRPFGYISNMKCYVISIHTFLYMCVCVCVYIYIYIWNLNFYKENFSIRIFHFIHFTNEYSPTLYHYYNLSLFIYIYISTTILH